MRGIAIIAAAATLALSGCGGAGDDAGSERPPGPLADALAEVGGGGEHGSLGVSWADPQLVRQAGFGSELLVDALAPNAKTVVESAPALRRRFGLDPVSAERLLSVGGSYAFGMRLDGVDGGGLARALRRDGGRSSSAGATELIDIGDYAVVPDPLLAADVNGLGAFDAFGSDFAVLAISDRARSALLGEGDRLLEQPEYEAAARCLGPDVVAARIVPDKQLLSIETGIDMVAIGTTAGSELLCVVGGTSDRAEAVTGALESALSPSSRDPVTGERLGRSIAATEVTSATTNGTETVRAEVERTQTGTPGFLFGTIASGSLISMLNGERESFLP